MRRLVHGIIAVSLVSVWTVGAAWAQAGPTKQNRQGPVTVAVTPASPLAAETPLRFRIVLDTHSVGLDDIAMERAVVLRTANGKDVAPSAVEQPQGSGHHRQAVFVFPPVADRGEVHVVVKNVGGVEERVFTWQIAAAR